MIGANMVVTSDIVEGEASRRGVEYEIANGVRIPNLGKRSFA